MTSPVRYVNGVTNVASDKPFGQFFAPDPTRIHGFFDDFKVYTPTQYLKTATSVGGGTSAAASSDANGGAIVITTAANEDDSLWCQVSGDGGSTMTENFTFATGKKAWFTCKFQGSEATQQDFMVGLWKDQADPIDTGPTDGVWFICGDASTSVNFSVVKNSVATTASTVATLANNTDITVGFYWDGVDTFSVFINGVLATTTGADTLPDDEVLCLSFGTQNGAAAAKTMTIDYIGAWMER